MSALSKAAINPSGQTRTPRPRLTKAELAALAADIGPVDPADAAAARAEFAEAVHSAPGTPTSEIVAAVQAKQKRRHGERGPQKAPTKQLVSLRLGAGTLARWRATGPGWQARMDEWLARGPV